MEQIVQSLLDTDFQMLAVGQCARAFFPDFRVRLEFINRGRTPFPRESDVVLKDQIDGLSSLSLHSTERAFLDSIPTLQPEYVDWYAQRRFDPGQVEVTQRDGELAFTMEAPWRDVLYWEVPLLATVSEMYGKMMGHTPVVTYLDRASSMARRLRLSKVPWMDFGTRRRFSSQVHRDVLSRALNFRQQEVGRGGLIGTSNGMLALQTGLPWMGTMNHAWFSVLAAIFGDQVEGSRQALALWRLMYGSQLSVALADTFTSAMFFRDVFTPEETPHWAAVRQDSGVPARFVDMLLDHYRGLELDPMQRQVVTSDGLNTDSAIGIHDYCEGRINNGSGIGTFFTNNVGHQPLNIVIKAMWVSVDGEWVRVVKLSDDPGKSSGV